MCIYIYISAVKWLIISFCLYNICVCCVYLLCIYKYTYMHVYISEKFYVCILNIFIYNMNIICKYFRNTVYTVCVCVFDIHNKYTQHTHIYILCKQKLLF